MKISISFLVAWLTINNAWAATTNDEINVPFRLAKGKIYSMKIAVPAMVYNLTGRIKGHP